MSYLCKIPTCDHTENCSCEMKFCDLECVMLQLADITDGMQQEFLRKNEFLVENIKTSMDNSVRIEEMNNMLLSLFSDSNQLENDLRINEYLLEQLEKRTQQLESSVASTTQACNEPYHKCADEDICGLAVYLEELISLAADYATEEKLQLIQNHSLCQLTKILDCQLQTLEHTEAKINDLCVLLHNVDIRFRDFSKQIYRTF